MCQAYEGERRSVAHQERDELIAKLERHESGETPLFQDEIDEIAVRLFMLADE